MIDESECLPFTRWWSLPSSLLRLQFSFSWLLAILPQQPLSENNHPRCVCYLKNWQPSQIAPIIHILDFWDSCAWETSVIVISFHCQCKWFLQHRALWSASHSGGRSALVLGCTLVHCGNYLQTVSVVWQSEKIKLPLWDKAAGLAQLCWVCPVFFLLTNNKA